MAKFSDRRKPLLIQVQNYFMVVVAMVCVGHFLGCSSVPTGRIRYINKQTGQQEEKASRTTQKQIQKRPYFLKIVPACWTVWQNELTRIEKIFEDIKAPVKLLNEITLWATIALGIASISIQTPGITTVLRRGAYATGMAYCATFALLFLFGFMIQFWWVILILILVVLSFMLKDQGVDLGKLWKRIYKRS